MSRAACLALRAYSGAGQCPACQGPSISLPRHQSFTACGSALPLDRLASDQWVPPSRLQYSTRSAASRGPRVPRLTAIIGSVPISRHQRTNSSTPKVFGSMLFHAKSGLEGRFSGGPTPSRQS